MYLSLSQSPIELSAHINKLRIWWAATYHFLLERSYSFVWCLYHGQQNIQSSAGTKLFWYVCCSSAGHCRPSKWFSQGLWKISEPLFWILFLLLQNEPHVDEVDDVNIDKCLSGCRQTRTALCLCVIVIWSNHNGCWRTQPHFITISVN